MKIDATVEKAFIPTDTSFIRYKAIAKHSSTCRAILVFFLIIKCTHLLCIFQLKSNFREKHDNLSKHGFKNTAAFSVQFCNLRAICRQYCKRQFSINIKSFKHRIASRFQCFPLEPESKSLLPDFCKTTMGSFPKI